MRGAMVVPFAFMHAFGPFLGAVALQIIKQTSPYAYKRAFYSQFAIVGLSLIPCILLPETHIFYCKKGQHDKPKKSLRFVIGYDLEHEQKVVQREVQDSDALIKTYGSSAWYSLHKWKMFRRTKISVLRIMMQGLAGAALTFGYSTDPFLGSVAMYVVLIVGVLCAVYPVEVAGRRRQVLVDASICILADIGIGGLAFAPVTGPAPQAIVALVCVWMAGYSVSLQAVGWLYLGELASVGLRAKSIGVASVFQSSVNLLLSYTVPLMLSPQKAGRGAKIGFFFGGISIFWLTLIYFSCPETKGRTATEIDELFEKGVPAWRSNSYFEEKKAKAAREAAGEVE
ncbi:hypothetical protein QFC22_006234 [Naganishia vaughanmartiniae]|uniref:Uncharacterized protein n=1 Tax=Naganishia vaughanmartiniae TaxID=1424756 RepID=A0ACC2WM65_9TREE|nr:hypothetical protein QFC22_006234 [Naganishia vaughanmartiniae]